VACGISDKTPAYTHRLVRGQLWRFARLTALAGGYDITKNPPRTIDIASDMTLDVELKR